MPVVLPRQAPIARAAESAPASILQKPLPVAVIVPCHNYGHFLAECLSSILAQKIAPAEVIVVDDASTDDTAAVAKRYDVRYVRIDAQSPHVARRTGIDLTTAQLVCCIDADDQLPVDYLAGAVPLFADPAVGVVYSPVQEFGGRTRYWNPQPGNIEVENFIHAGAVARRTALERSKAFARDNEAITEDYEVWRRVLADGWQTARNPVPYLYRRHAAGRSNLVPEKIDRVVVAAYYMGQPDPQRHILYGERWELVERWVATVRMQGLRGIILHDGLSAEFAARCAGFGVECVYMATGPEDLGNTWRYTWYLEWLGHNDVATAFFTDLFDVHFNDDPFKLLRQDYDLWVGNEPQLIGESTWMLERLNCIYGDTWPAWLKERQILNCGIIGGFAEPLKRLFRQMIQDRDAARQAKRVATSDMPALNKAIYCDWDLSRVWAKGAPLHSVFKAFDEYADVAIVHK